MYSKCVKFFDMINPNNHSLSGMPDVHFSVAGIQHQLTLLDTNKASGPDNISPFILKHCCNEISPSYMTSNFHPVYWHRYSNVCPVFKKGNQTHASNYRPISLTSICCKTIEHIIYHSIIQHLNSHNVLIANQHGFRSQHSCTTQLISLLEDLSYSMDHHQQTDVILLQKLLTVFHTRDSFWSLGVTVLLTIFVTGSAPGLLKDLSK